jgi:hypothetical protein
MNQAYLLHRAQQRDPQAIATLLNQSLQGRRVKVIEAVFRDSCLQLKVQSRQVPNHHEIIPFIQKEIKSLGVRLIRQIQVSGLTLTSQFPAWEKSIFLEDELSLLEHIACYNIVKPELFAAGKPKVSSYSSAKNRSHSISKSPKHLFPQGFLLLLLCVGFSWGIAVEIYYSYQQLKATEKTALFLPINSAK